MNFAIDLIFAFGLDLMLGDPEWFHHPVRFIGALINWLERITRRIFPNERVAGTITGLLTVIVSGLVVYATIRLANLADPVLGRIAGIVWLYLGLSARSLADSAHQISDDLYRGDLPAARKSLSCIVGRDTKNLNESEISRGAVESVAENTVDGILTPIFFAFIGSFMPFCAAPMMWAFKGMNTCDSMIGHKDEKYIRFGTFSARLDDVANYVPARLCYILFPIASLFLGYSPEKSFAVALRDSKNHDSPNAGIPEAATAGALEVRLGGTTYYDGLPHEKRPFGAEFLPPGKLHIRRSVHLMWAVTVLMILAIIHVGIFLA
ncbi:MAG TPA: cobalamin biosynthesis protein CobD [Lentisphaeria bacterium]|nr:MAG: cobalamin biosynthesis protein CobD [Lentisphaerae bacterium GWF2_49_21]HBC87951.1 cobalamin biosynthesis protein CobD [Lentisphaeria bacterium]